MLDLATAAGQPPESLADFPFFQKKTTFQFYIPSRKAHLKLGQSRKGRHFLKTKRNGFDSTTALFLLEAAVSVIGKNISVKPLWIVQASTSSPENPWTFTVMVFIVFVPKSLVLTFTYFHKIQKPLILHKTQLNNSPRPIFHSLRRWTLMRKLCLIKALAAAQIASCELGAKHAVDILSWWLSVSCPAVGALFGSRHLQLLTEWPAAIGRSGWCKQGRITAKAWLQIWPTAFLWQRWLPTLHGVAATNLASGRCNG